MHRANKDTIISVVLYGKVSTVLCIWWSVCHMLVPWQNATWA